MTIPLLLLLSTAPAGERAIPETHVVARVREDLEVVDLEVKVRGAAARDGAPVHVVFAAERYRAIDAIRTATEHEIFPNGHSFGGFSDVALAVDGRPCAPEALELEGGARALRCPVDPGSAHEVSARARLTVPERFGGVGRFHRQLTLAGGWYPYLAEPGHGPPRGRTRVEVVLPTGFGAVLGGRWFPPQPGEAQRVEVELDGVAQVPLVVLPPTAAGVRVAGGRALLVTASGVSAREPETQTTEERELLRTLREGLTFFDSFGLDPGAPWVFVVAPLRHELSISTETVTLVSDRAFRMTPWERFLRFHRIPLLRAAFTTALLGRRWDEAPDDHRIVAEAAAAELADRLVRTRYGRAEDVFDVLSFWSFIPAVDLLLYAPDVPFQSAYFRRVDETDPLTPNFVDFPSAKAGGKVVFEKLLDRLGLSGTERVFEGVLRGRRLEDAVADGLGTAEAARFLSTWLAPYPRVQYRLVGHGAEPIARSFELASGPESASLAQPSKPVSRRLYRAWVDIERTGDVVAEPVQVRLLDHEGLERLVWSETTTAARRRVTAIMRAPLDEVELDPKGRLVETATDEVPSPRLDNRSYTRTRVLVNNWNLSVAATQGTVDTALDLGFSRQWDVRWRFAARADLDPGAVGLSGRAAYGFGPAVTPARLAHALGLALESAYLRPKFGATRESAWSAGARLFWIYDDRASIWAAEPGLALSASLDWTHVFGTLREEVEGEPPREVSSDSLALSVRAVRSWRFGGAHEVTLRGTAGAIVLGEPRRQLLFRIGGRSNVRGFAVDALLGEARAIVGSEWLHHLLPETNDNFLGVTWLSRVDGALYGDVAMLARHIESLDSAEPVADLGYGLRLYIDYFGVRPGVMAIDVAFPFQSSGGRFQVGSPAVYVDFAQSF